MHEVTGEMDILDSQDAQCILEAALLCAPEPMTIREMRVLFDDALSAEAVRAHLTDIAVRWDGRGAELRELATGWRFQTLPHVQEYLDKLNPEKPPKYSRATMETLAIIAYKQPVTRGDIEDIRGVTVSTQIVKMLEDRGWIEVIGHRDAPGRPGLYATTRDFLADMGLQSLQQLPELSSLAVGQQALPGLDEDLTQAAAAVAADLAAQDDDDGQATLIEAQASLVDDRDSDEADSHTATTTATDAPADIDQGTQAGTDPDDDAGQVTPFSFPV